MFVHLKKYSLLKIDNKFTITTTKDVYECKFLTVATGYYGQHNKLEVKGAELPKVQHYFKKHTRF